MKSVLILCVLIGTCLSVPLLNSQSPAIKTTKHAMINNMRTRNVMKRDISQLEAEIEAFRLVDLNGNGHITEVEWALFYMDKDLPGVPKIGYHGWIYAFKLQMKTPGFDTNNNGQMELSEFLSI